MPGPSSGSQQPIVGASKSKKHWKSHLKNANANSSPNGAAGHPQKLNSSTRPSGAFSSIPLAPLPHSSPSLAPIRGRGSVAVDLLPKLHPLTAQPPQSSDPQKSILAASSDSDLICVGVSSQAHPIDAIPHGDAPVQMAENPEKETVSDSAPTALQTVTDTPIPQPTTPPTSVAQFWGDLAEGAGPSEPQFDELNEEAVSSPIPPTPVEEPPTTVIDTISEPSSDLPPQIEPPAEQFVEPPPAVSEVVSVAPISPETTEVAVTENIVSEITPEIPVVEEKEVVFEIPPVEAVLEQDPPPPSPQPIHSVVETEVVAESIAPAVESVIETPVPAVIENPSSPPPIPSVLLDAVVEMVVDAPVVGSEPKTPEQAESKDAIVESAMEVDFVPSKESEVVEAVPSMMDMPSTTAIPEDPSLQQVTVQEEPPSSNAMDIDLPQEPLVVTPEVVENCTVGAPIADDTPKPPAEQPESAPIEISTPAPIVAPQPVLIAVTPLKVPEKTKPRAPSKSTSSKLPKKPKEEKMRPSTPTAPVNDFKFNLACPHLASNGQEVTRTEVTLPDNATPVYITMGTPVLPMPRSILKPARILPPLPDEQDKSGSEGANDRSDKSASEPDSASSQPSTQVQTQTIMTRRFMQQNFVPIPKEKPKDDDKSQEEPVQRRVRFSTIELGFSGDFLYEEAEKYEQRERAEYEKNRPKIQDLFQRLNPSPPVEESIVVKKTGAASTQAANINLLKSGAKASSLGPSAAASISDSQPPSNRKRSSSLTSSTSLLLSAGGGQSDRDLPTLSKVQKEALEKLVLQLRPVSIPIDDSIPEDLVRCFVSGIPEPHRSKVEESAKAKQKLRKSKKWTPKDLRAEEEREKAAVEKWRFSEGPSFTPTSIQIARTIAAQTVKQLRMEAGLPPVITYLDRLAMREEFKKATAERREISRLKRIQDKENRAAGIVPSPVAKDQEEDEYDADLVQLDEGKKVGLKRRRAKESAKSSGSSRKRFLDEDLDFEYDDDDDEDDEIDIEDVSDDEEEYIPMLKKIGTKQGQIDELDYERPTPMLKRARSSNLTRVTPLSSPQSSQTKPIVKIVGTSLLSSPVPYTFSGTPPIMAPTPILTPMPSSEVPKPEISQISQISQSSVPDPSVSTESPHKPAPLATETDANLEKPQEPAATPIETKLVEPSPIAVAAIPTALPAIVPVIPTPTILKKSGTKLTAAKPKAKPAAAKATKAVKKRQAAGRKTTSSGMTANPDPTSNTEAAAPLEGSSEPPAAKKQKFGKLPPKASAAVSEVQDEISTEKTTAAAKRASARLGTSSDTVPPLEGLPKRPPVYKPRLKKSEAVAPVAQPALSSSLEVPSNIVVATVDTSKLPDLPTTSQKSAPKKAGKKATSLTPLSLPAASTSTEQSIQMPVAVKATKAVTKAAAAKKAAKQSKAVLPTIPKLPTPHQIIIIDEVSSPTHSEVDTAAQTGTEANQPQTSPEAPKTDAVAVPAVSAVFESHSDANHMEVDTAEASQKEIAEPSPPAAATLDPEPEGLEKPSESTQIDVVTEEDVTETKPAEFPEETVSSLPVPTDESLLPTLPVVPEVQIEKAAEEIQPEAIEEPKTTNDGSTHLAPVDEPVASSSVSPPKKQERTTLEELIELGVNIERSQASLANIYKTLEILSITMLFCHTNLRQSLQSSTLGPSYTYHLLQQPPVLQSAIPIQGGILPFMSPLPAPQSPNLQMSPSTGKRNAKKRARTSSSTNTSLNESSELDFVPSTLPLPPININDGPLPKRASPAGWVPHQSPTVMIEPIMFSQTTPRFEPSHPQQMMPLATSSPMNKPAAYQKKLASGAGEIPPSPPSSPTGFSHMSATQMLGSQTQFYGEGETQQTATQALPPFSPTLALGPTQLVPLRLQHQELNRSVASDASETVPTLQLPQNRTPIQNSNYLIPRLTLATPRALRGAPSKRELLGQMAQLGIHIEAQTTHTAKILSSLSHFAQDLKPFEKTSAQDPLLSQDVELTLSRMAGCRQMLQLLISSEETSQATPSDHIQTVLMSMKELQVRLERHINDIRKILSAFGEILITAGNALKEAI